MNIFTDNQDFYPTPANIIYKMLESEDLEWKSILEPSAWKWDILKRIKERQINNRKNSSNSTYFIFSFIDYKVYGKYYKVIYLINVILLLLVFVIGDKRLGAQRWIDLGFITIQPSEFSKLFIGILSCDSSSLFLIVTSLSSKDS